MNCPVCGHDNPSDYAYCGGCGRSRTAPVPSSRPHAAPGGPAPAPLPYPRAADADDPIIVAPADASSDATRYLCSAVHLDSAFALRVVRDVVDTEHRAVAASPGVSIGTVARHALAARRRQLVRDGALAVLAVLALVALLRGAGALLLLWLVLAWATVLAESLLTRYAVVARTLNRQSFRPDAGPAPTSPRLRRRLEEISTREGGNVIVHSGFSPFVGCGFPLGGWSFAVDVTKPLDPGGRPRPFTVVELTEHVARSLSALQWPAVRIEPKVVVSGGDIRHDLRFLPDAMGPPVSQVDEGVLRSLLVSSEDRARPYLQVRVTGWHGELIASMFVRLVLLRSSVFVETSYSLLTPVQERYHEVDRLVPQPTAGQTASLALRAVGATVRLLLVAPVRVVEAAASPMRRAWRERGERRRISADLAFDYGTAVSIRELASDRSFQRYFQRLDKEMYLKIVENRLLDGLVGFLEDHGVDTTALVERSTTILNNGVLVTGSGQLRADNVAVGANARAGALAARVAGAVQAVAARGGSE